MLETLPLVIYLYFPEAEWRVGNLGPGIYPLKRRSRTWKVNKHTGIQARRTGFWFLPDFGTTAHMIQGATLEAAFVDLQHASSKVSITSQIAVYVCLSRVKFLLKICVLQAFSAFLFSRGNPKGPERPTRKLAEHLTWDEALAEWEAEDGEEAAAEEEKNDPMAIKHICASCYLQGKKQYMLDAASFGVQNADDFYPKYVSQGGWTRCLDCQKAVGADASRSAQADMTPDRASRKRDSLELEEATEENAPGESDACKRCKERKWNGKLTAGHHGCSACENLFETSTWNAQLIKNHRHSNRDLVCPRCVERGFTPSKYEKHECEECLETFGSLRFDADLLKNWVRRPDSRKVCKDCQNKLRCGACKHA